MGMSSGGQSSNPWGNYSRGPAGTSYPGSGVSPSAPSVTQPGSVDPRFMNGGYNPNGNVNPFSGWGNRGAGAGPTAPGSGVSPQPPSITEPGTFPETGGPFNPMTGSTTPMAPPTLETGGPFNPMTGSTTPSATPTLQGSMNHGMNPSGQYAGQQAPMHSGPGQFYGIRKGNGPGQPYEQGGPGRFAPPSRYYQDSMNKPGSLPNVQTDDAGYVRSLYSGLLGRDPSQDEVSNASQALTGQYGGDRSKLADFFRQSEEFKAKGPTGAPPNIYGGPGTGAPYDPRTQGYQPGAGWQTMLRQYSMGAGQNPNQYIQDRGMRPMWGDQRQSWEPDAPPAGMGLSELLRQYRGY